MKQLSHLTTAVAEALELPKPERIAFCQTDRWIEYTRASQILNQLDQMLIYPRSLRMPNLLIVGRSGNGKSSILEHFCNRHPIQVTPSGTPVVPILKIDMPETPDETEFWSTILWAMGISHREKDPAAIKKRQVISTLQYACVRLLVIDELNNLANAGKGAGDLLAAIKGLSNTLKVSIVASGTQAAINALNTEPQMKSRFEPTALDRWKLNSEYLRFLASYEQLLPLAEPSELASRALAPKIYGMAGDAIGGTVKLLKAASVRAIEMGKERITGDVLDSMGWTRLGDWDAVARVV